MSTKISASGSFYGRKIDFNKFASGGFSSVRYLSRLASAESRGAVIMLKRSLRREIYKVTKSGGDEAQIKAAVARIRHVMKKADEKIIGLNRERRMQERIKQAKYAEKREEEQFISKKYRSGIYNRKLCERLNVARAAVGEKEQIRESDFYKNCNAAGTDEMTAENTDSGNAYPSIDIMI